MAHWTKHCSPQGGAAVRLGAAFPRLWSGMSINIKISDFTALKSRNKLEESRVNLLKGFFKKSKMIIIR